MIKCRFLMKILSILLLFTVLNCFADLDELNHRVHVELDWLGYPADWISQKEGVFDVAIIGAGMSGCSAAFALKKLGIHNLCIFDENEEGKEGPWNTYGHMKILRSGKCTVGPSCFFPSLTFQAWYEATFGTAAWNQLEKATPLVWNNYLLWFRKVLHLPVKNHRKVFKIRKSNSYLELQMSDGQIVHAKKVILATGRAGAGGVIIPEFAKPFSKQWVDHTINLHNFNHLKGKKILILGCGSSAYDAAAEALEAGAAKVTLLFRRHETPTKNLLSGLIHPGVEKGFYDLKDEQKCDLIKLTNDGGIPPPKEALERVQPFSNFSLSPSTSIQKIDLMNNQLVITTNKGVISGDYLILATGFQIDLEQVPEIHEIYNKIVTWEEHTKEKKLSHFPYLGAAFQFLPKHESDSYIKDIYCFNYGALLSHGLISSTIDSISAGAERLANGIAADFFLQEYFYFLENLDEESD